MKQKLIQMRNNTIIIKLFKHISKGCTFKATCHTVTVVDFMRYFNLFRSWPDLERSKVT